MQSHSAYHNFWRLDIFLDHLNSCTSSEKMKRELSSLCIFIMAKILIQVFFVLKKIDKWIDYFNRIKILKYRNFLSELLFAHYKREADLALEKSQDSIVDILTNRHLRIPFLLCLVANIGSTVSGNSIKGYWLIINQLISINKITSGSYLDELFISFGIPKEMSTIPIMFIYLSATIIGVFTAIFLVERVGRRPLMLFSMLLDMLG